jgi:hypothetical protein
VWKEPTFKRQTDAVYRPRPEIRSLLFDIDAFAALLAALRLHMLVHKAGHAFKHVTGL